MRQLKLGCHDHLALLGIDELGHHFLLHLLVLLLGYHHLHGLAILG